MYMNHIDIEFKVKTLKENTENLILWLPFTNYHYNLRITNPYFIKGQESIKINKGNTDHLICSKYL